ncbi:hypothetical protein KUTeg_014527 [Tegillarca granosa]|uniref:Ileal sodium/bile acid cotransporter n=1 Tax=Tegillarca granosa TaxID=220873 RepID=A0ABQ9EVC9_TEGGR|nr:hypothetical protein KUTeg_014527 [Tegillarca granosa]
MAEGDFGKIAEVSSNTSLFFYNDTSNVTWGNFTQQIQSKPSILRITADIAIKVTLIIIMLGMGTLKKPTGIAIGMLSQFIVLPLVTFGFAHALQLPPLPALGMLVVSCCPGGSTSNVFSYWVDGDVPLSLSMTAVSTVLATGMMPLNLFIYSRSWTKETLAIPYVNIMISFVMTVGPAVIGIFLRWKWPRFAYYVVKCGSIAGAFSVVLLLTLLSVQYPFMYQSSWKIYFAAFALPMIGFAFGFCVAALFRMEQAHRRTVALETGIQNFPLCMTLLTLTFTREIFAKISLFPLMYGVTCIICSMICVAIYKLVTKLKNNQKKSIKFTNVSDKEDIES